MMKFADRENWKTFASETALKLNKLVHLVEPLNKMETGINLSTRPAAYDLVLTADFEDEAGLEDYRIHPEHVKVLNYLQPLLEKSTVVDYLINN
jgi:hypothetical protein